MSWQFDGLAHGVDDPTKDLFAGAPASISFVEFLQGDSFVPMGFSWQRLVQDCVDGDEEVLSNLVEAIWTSLGYLDEVIDKDICGAQGLVQRPVGRGGYFVGFYREDLNSRKGH
jgi:hypothetical protein